MLVCQCRQGKYGESRVGSLDILTKLMVADALVQQLASFGNTLMNSGQYSQEAPPDPMALFRLPNEVQASSNVFAFQKAFGSAQGGSGGSWGFDVYYENTEGSSDDEGMSRESPVPFHTE